MFLVVRKSLKVVLTLMAKVVFFVFNENYTSDIMPVNVYIRTGVELEILEFRL